MDGPAFNFWMQQSNKCTPYNYIRRHGEFTRYTANGQIYKVEWIDNANWVETDPPNTKIIEINCRRIN